MFHCAAVHNQHQALCKTPTYFISFNVLLSEVGMIIPILQKTGRSPGHSVHRTEKAHSEHFESLNE